MRSPDYYAMLGVLRTATQEQIKRAYLRSAKKLHPDANTSPGETELFLDVQKAYEVLADVEKRAAYDASLPPDEEGQSQVKMKVHYSRQAVVRQNESQLIYVLFEFSPAVSAGETAHPPLNVCLVLDCSTSMKGVKLDMVKATASQLISKLRPQDVFSVVSFNDRAEVIIPATRNINPRRAQLNIQMLGTGGATEIYTGLKTGYDEVSRYLNPGNINHIILLTDGHTYGDEPKCMKLAEIAADQGIGISGMGIGSGWNDIFLDSLANRTGGSCMYVSDPQDIQRLLTEKFDQFSQTYAEDMQLEFALIPEVVLNYALRIHPEPGPLPIESPIRFGPILRDSPLSILMEFRINNISKKIESLDFLSGVATPSISSLPFASLPLPVQLTRVAVDHVNTEPPPHAIVQALSHLTLYRMQERARADVAAGNYDQASTHLQRMATHLLAQGERSLAKTILLESENIQRQKSFSEEGEKQIKFGTRALMLGSGKNPK